jgi:hypothetical protein
VVGDLEGLGDAVQIVRQQFLFEVPGRAVDGPRVAGLLVDADHQAAALLAQVALAARVHDVGQFLVALVDLGDVVGHQVLVLHGVERMIDPDHLADLARPQPTGVDHLLGRDRALLGDHLPGAVAARVQLEHPVAQHDLRALDPRRLGIGVGGTGGIQVAVERVVERAEQALGIGDRADLGDLLGAHELGVEPHVTVLGALGLEEVHAFGGVRDGQAADVVQAAGLAADLLELLVELDGVALERRDVGIGVEGVEAAGGVPGRARGQLRALDQHDVAPAVLGQVIEHAAADHAAADHHHPNVGPHRSRLPVSLCPGRELAGPHGFASSPRTTFSAEAGPASAARGPRPGPCLMPGTAAPCFVHNARGDCRTC